MPPAEKDFKLAFSISNNLGNKSLELFRKHPLEGFPFHPPDRDTLRRSTPESQLRPGDIHPIINAERNQILKGPGQFSAL